METSILPISSSDHENTGSDPAALCKVRRVFCLQHHMHPDGRPMEEADWDGDGRVLGMYLNGHGIQGMDERGGPIVDDHFCLFFNAGAGDVPLVLPPQEYAGRWAAVIDTAGELDPEAPLHADAELTLPARSVDASLREQAGRGAS